jgi:hypothetical protein
MADDESPLVRDIRISDAGMYITNEDSMSHINLFGTDGKFFEKSFNEKYMYLLSSSNGS